MDFRYFVDADSGLPHIYNHGVDEHDVEFVVRHAGEDRPGRNGSLKWLTGLNHDFRRAGMSAVCGN